MKKEEKQILNKLIQDRRNCTWYVGQGKRGEFCVQPHHHRNFSGYLTWGLCEGTCNDFELKRIRGRKRRER